MKQVLLKKGVYYDIVNDCYVFKKTIKNFNELPLCVGLQLTRKCNLKCLHCSDYQKINDSSFDKIKIILEILAKSGLKRISLTGGEPLLRSDIVKILKFAKNNCLFTITLITNGTLLNEKTIKQIKPYVDNIRISIHGPEDYHDKFVGVLGSYKKAIKSVKICQKFNIPVIVVTSLLLSNINSLEKISDLVCRKLRVKRWRIFTLIARGRAREIFDKEFIHAYDVKRIYKKIFERKNSNGWLTTITLKNWRLEGRCLLLLPEGSLIGVPSFRNKGNQYYAGNILKKSLKSMWKAYPYKENYWKAKIRETNL